MSWSTRVTENGQVTIPKELREKYDLDPGDEVVWLDTDEGIVVTKRTRPAGDCSFRRTRPTRRVSSVAEELVERVQDRRERNHDEA